MQKNLTISELRGVLERGAVWYSVSNGVTKLVAIANTLIVLSSLTPYAYGVAELALSVVGVFSIFQLAGLEKTVVADMGVEKGVGNFSRVRRLFQDYITLQVIFCTAAWAILFWGADMVAHFFTSEIGSYFIIISFLFLVAPLTAAMRMLFSIYFDFTATAVFTFLQEACKLVFLLFFFGTVSISVVLWSYVIAQFAPCVLMLPRTVRHGRSIIQAPIVDKSSMISFFQHHNLWTLFSNYLDTFTKSVRLWFIKFFLGTEMVALFAVAQGIVGQLSSFGNLNTIVAPVLPQYVHQKTVFYRIIHVTLKYQLILALSLIVGGVLGVPYLVALFFPQYEAVLPLFFLIILILIPSSFSTVFQSMVYVLKAQKDLFFAQFVRLFLVCLFSVVAFPLLGFVGIALEYIATTIIFSYGRYRVLTRLLPDFRLRTHTLFMYDDYDRMLIRRIQQRMLSFARR